MENHGVLAAKKKLCTPIHKKDYIDATWVVLVASALFFTAGMFFQPVITSPRRTGNDKNEQG